MLLPILICSENFGVESHERPELFYFQKVTFTRTYLIVIHAHTHTHARPRVSVCLPVTIEDQRAL